MVSPELPADENFEFIWRAARSTRWLPDLRVLTVTADARLSPIEALECILASTSGEYGVNLVLTPSTAWLNVPAALQSDLSEVVARVA
jgi:hypothetical protein